MPVIGLYLLLGGINCPFEGGLKDPARMMLQHKYPARVPLHDEGDIFLITLLSLE